MDGSAGGSWERFRGDPDVKPTQLCASVSSPRVPYGSTKLVLKAHVS